MTLGDSRQRMLRRATLALALALCCAWAAAQAPDAAPAPIVIGVISELTGAGAVYGRDLVRGAEMAVREINAAGGIKGRPLRLSVGDGGTNPARSAVAMRRLVTSEAALIVGGWGSAQVLANLEVAEEAGMPYVVVGATHPAITSPRNRWTFRVIQTDTAQADALADVVANRLRARRVAIIGDSGAYGAGSRDAFLASLDRRGLKALQVESFDGGANDFTAPLSRIREARPDVLAIFGTLPAVPVIMRQARTLGIAARFVGTGGLANDELLGAAGSAAEGTLLTGLFHEDSDAQAKAWAQRYRQAFANEAEPPRPQLAAWEYRAIRFIVEPCLQTVEPQDRVALRSCLAGWRGRLFGVDGVLAFDSTRQLVQPVLMLQVRDGRFTVWQEGR